MRKKNELMENAYNLMHASMMFKDFYEREPDMNNVNDIMNLIMISYDVAYARENAKHIMEFDGRAM